MHNILFMSSFNLSLVFCLLFSTTCCLCCEGVWIIVMWFVIYRQYLALWKCFGHLLAVGTTERKHTRSQCTRTGAFSFRTIVAYCWGKPHWRGAWWVIRWAGVTSDCTSANDWGPRPAGQLSEFEREWTVKKPWPSVDSQHVGGVLCFVARS